MSETLIITRKDNKIITAAFEENEMLQVSVEKIEAENILGNIYIGKVKNIIKNINAAFVEVEGKTMCYLPLDSNDNPIFTIPKKNKKIAVGDTIMVQIAKENVKTKAAYATTNFNFTGKYIVLTHGKCKIGISKKITSEEERERLKDILSSHKNENYGLIARTNCEGASLDQIEQEIKVFDALYENIIQFGVHKSRFTCIYHAPKTYVCNIRDGISDLLQEIVTDDDAICDEIKEYLNLYQREDLKKLRFYEDTNFGLNQLYGIETKLEKALQKQVWLKSGGTLVIEPTEALTVIDVNTGKAIKGKRNVQETFRKVNMEAAKEIAKQIRLRNLSGIILIDFIDLESNESKTDLLRFLNSLLKKDPIGTILVDMTALGLVEITRKKVRKPLHEQVKNSII
ncbi:MAG: ribonuclease E/G [Velocimicrobium sp.]